VPKLSASSGLTTQTLIIDPNLGDLRDSSAEVTTTLTVLSLTILHVDGEPEAATPHSWEVRYLTPSTMRQNCGDSSILQGFLATNLEIEVLHCMRCL
jgi:hypothetical protein